MGLTLRSVPHHSRPFPFRTRTGQLHQLGPKYMAKRPSLTIEIPSGEGSYEKFDRVHEVSCFSPFTPDDESCESESVSSPLDYTGEECVAMAAQDSDSQSLSNHSEDEMDGNQISMVRIGPRWSRLYQRSSLQSIIAQAHLTPPRRKRRSPTSVLPSSSGGSDSYGRSPRPVISTRGSPSQKIVHSCRRRRSNPFDCFATQRSSKVCIIDQTPTTLDFLTVMNSPLPLDVSDDFSTTKTHMASTRRNETC